MTLTQTATSVPLAWISRFELLNWMAKLSSCRSGTRPARSGSATITSSYYRARPRHHQLAGRRSSATPPTASTRLLVGNKCDLTAKTRWWTLPPPSQEYAEFPGNSIPGDQRPRTRARPTWRQAFLSTCPRRSRHEWGL
uniref:Uncharacterized protein n=1 Tax=Macrostomum lignano TaxID=282301 RepID=A0A1I8FMK8_9PLAT